MKHGARTRDYESALFWLKEAKVINACYNATEPNIGMKMNEDEQKFKLYLADTGLLLSHGFEEDMRIMRELYRKLILGKMEINKGMLVENLVAQMLCATGKSLYYYVNPDKKDRIESIEIDFLISKPIVTNRHNICPIEVKSTQRYSLSSLRKFSSKFRENIATCYVIHSGIYKEEEGITYLPIYMTPCL